MIGIGIDTGGTCTDAVVYDTESRKVISSAKTLTTKLDLKIGILNALKKLDRDAINKASFISLSTTLATNACVENKGGRAKLILIGVNPKVVERMQGSYGLPPTSEIYFMDGDPEDSNPDKRKPDWEDFESDIQKFSQYDSVAIVQINPKFNNGAYENKAEEILLKHLDIVCVRGYELFQEINVQKRAATALLNARLLPVMDEFFKAIEASLEEMEIKLPLAIVRSDGSVMSKDFAKKRPVETLLCGPAASVIGAMELSNSKDCMVIDMGGTTSDIAVIKNGVPVSSFSGIRVGGWNTMVKGIAIDTFALGGDSGISVQNGIMRIEERKMIPLCVLASMYPETVMRTLKEIDYRGGCRGYAAYEHFVLINKPKDLDRFTKKEKLLIKELEKGPLSIETAAAIVSTTPNFIRFDRLENEGIVIRAGITPTDAMHVKGEYTEFDVEASRIGIAYVGRSTDKSTDETAEEIYHLVKERMYSNLARILMKHENEAELKPEEEAHLYKLASWIYRNDINSKAKGSLKASLETDLRLVGVGAPTAVFLGDTGRLLRTDCDFPEYAQIANAIGAAAGNVTARYTVRIEPDMRRNLGYDFYVVGGDEFEGFFFYEQALERAKELAEAIVREKAAAQGAKGEITVSLDVKEDFFKASEYSSAIFVETVIEAIASSSLV